VAKLRVRCVRDRVDLEGGHVGIQHFQLCHVCLRLSRSS
jgi:hypothetical protein